MKIVIVAGTRPNFMKVAPIFRAIDSFNKKDRCHDSSSSKAKEKLKKLTKKGIVPILVHTGQHYDHNMSQTFFNDLGIRSPDYNLEVGSGSHAEQTAKIMVEFEKVCLQVKPDYVLVVGDVNSTIAAGLVAKKLNLRLIHVEAGLRSGDKSMPEEINRLATDSITDIFFTTEPDGTANLLKEGHSKGQIFFVGHVMIDNLFYQLNKVQKGYVSEHCKRLKKQLPVKYICMTLHRPSNVDNKEILEKILLTVNNLSKEYELPVIFSCHPRTKRQIKFFKLDKYVINASLESNTCKIVTGIYLLNPLCYNDFLYLWKDCLLVLTDSGGLQEETTALKVPCVTLRENTERPITCQIGSNTLIGNDPDKLKSVIKEILSGNVRNSRIPDLWDGKASKRIIDILIFL